MRTPVYRDTKFIPSRFATSLSRYIKHNTLETRRPRYLNVHREAVQRQRNIAAIPSFDDEGGRLRVYYLADNGEIVESVRSEDGVAWRSNRLGFFAVTGSALAAARSDLHFPAVRLTLSVCSWLMSWVLLRSCERMKDSRVSNDWIQS